MDRLSLNKLDFPKLLTLISAKTHSPVSRDALIGLNPLQDKEEIRLRALQISEIRKVYQQGVSVGIGPFTDIRPLIRKNTPVGAMLDGLELYSLIPVLENFHALIGLAVGHPEFVNLKAVLQAINSYPELLKRLKRSVDHEGNVLETASPLLKEIRSAIKTLEGKIRKRLESIVQSPEVSPFLQDDFITQRSGRWVIPVRMDSKGQVSGVVHDVSNSGETAFIEPLGVINLTNELENLRADEKAEEIRVLRDISSSIRANSEGLLRSFEALVYFDILNAIALYAEELSMEMPLIDEGRGLRLFNARHPLLYEGLKMRGIEDRLVPLNVTIERDRSVMVITGPNAGGKTIALKTIGLLTLMALTGMPVPAASMSVFPIFRKILVDIGDEQSLEDSLSTFAGHITNLSRFINEADASTLVLIDELGTGTDPVEGAALASAILKALRETNAIVVANTHLSEIKGFVHRSEGMVNASMEFDPIRFTPLYRLSIGMPGQSYAFETARRYGMPEWVIQDAHNLLGSQRLELDSMIRDLQQKSHRYEELSEELQRRLSGLEAERERAKALVQEAEETKREILLKAHKEAEGLLQGLRAEIFQLLEEAKRQDRAQLKASLKKVEQMAKAINRSSQELRPIMEHGTLKIEDLRVGDKVYSKIADAEATVLQVNQKQGRVRVGARGIEFEVPVDDLSLLKEDGKVVGDSEPVSTIKTNGSVRTINLIGKRVDEALSELEPFLNHAFLSGISEAVIIHGIGTGALKRAIQGHLKGHRLVKKFRQGTPAEGGVGVTVVSLMD